MITNTCGEEKHTIKNATGSIWYGMHFYPGLAQYDDPANGSSLRVFLNENTIRSMDRSFEGKPVYVNHVDEVTEDIDKLKGEVDGWVVESFYNSADGKHWVKFIICSEKGERAIKNGFRLSNAYIPKKMITGGIWNGLQYDQEITEAEFEHLAIVNNPRYDESVILSPEKFKQYNEDKLVELKRIANSKEKGTKMKFSFFKKTKVENDIDPELMVILPRSKKSVSVAKLINDAYEKDQDPAIEKKQDSAESGDHHSMADMDHMVKMHDGSYMKVKDMMNKYKSMNDDLEDMKKKKDSNKNKEEKEMDLKDEPESVDVEGDLHNDPDSEHDKSKAEDSEMKDSLEHPEEVVHDAEDPEDDKEAKKKALQLADHEDKEIEEAKAKSAKKKNALEKAERLRNAEKEMMKSLSAAQNEMPTVELSCDMVQRGIKRYGSGK